MTRDSGKIKTERRRIREVVRDIAVWSGIAAVVCGGIGLFFGPVWAACGAVGGALLVAEIKEAGWRCVGLHVCGKTTATFEDMISTGVDFLDMDYLVSAEKAIALARDRVALRGNLDPSAVFRFGSPDKVKRETAALCKSAAGSRWIIGSGCDIPPGTPAENIAACVETVRAFAPV
jgi:uroporphyrinogen-III decarboxylase